MSERQIELQGYLYGLESSRRAAARLVLNAEGAIRLEREEDAFVVGQAWETHITDCSVSDRVGNTPRFVSHPAFGRFETPDNDALDYALAHYHQSGEQKLGLVSRWAYRLESNARIIALTLAFTLFFSFGFVRYGIPWLAELAANALPTSVAMQVGQGSLDVLDDAIFDASQLPQERQDKLKHDLEALAKDVEADYPVQVVFRQSDLIGANALALPDGTIVFTDGMVDAAENDNELRAIMLHEIAHVRERHALRRMLQQAGLATLILVIAGDVNSASALVVTLPTLLLDAGYSREMEREADDYAAQQMQRLGIPHYHFADIMRRLVPVSDEASEAEREALSLLDTHPGVEERIKRFEGKPGA